jgi:creatinine amidohydrolase/Fe(II)-dependent formamide hydrolase-like protein
MSAAHPDYAFVTFPVVALGEGGVEELAGQWDHTGTFALRYQTLRNVAIDLGSEIARKGFKNIFLINAHGGFLHNVAFSDAAALVSERYDARMVNVGGYVFAEAFYSPAIMEAHLGPDWEEKMGLIHHGGAPETAQMLFLQEGLVSPIYKQLPAFVARDWGEFFDVSERDDWQGYWGHPAAASVNLGEDQMEDLVDRGFGIAEKALAGEDLSELPVYPESFLQVLEARAYFEALRQHYRQQTAEIEAWLEERATRSNDRP